MDCSLPSSSVYGDSPGKKPGVGCHALLQEGSSQPKDRTQVSLIQMVKNLPAATRETQEHWSGKPLLSPGDLPNSGIEPGSPALQVDSLPAELPGKPYSTNSLPNL